MEWVFTVVLLVLVVGLYAHVMRSEERQRLKTEVANAERKRAAYDSTRTVAIQNQYAAKSITKKVLERGAKLDTAVAELKGAALAVDTVTPEVATLLKAVDSVRVAALLYRTQVDSLVYMHERERKTWQDALAAADSALVAYDRVLQQQRAAECRVFGLPCPTRTQSFLAGTVILLWLAR
jgi:predicted transcriptional regulator